MAGKITNQELDSSVVTKLSSSDSHISNTSNPHSTTASQVGAEPANANIQTHIGSTSNPHSVTYSQVGAASSTHNHSGIYEPAISSGTTSQYWRGDKTWQTIDLSGYSTKSSIATVSLLASNWVGSSAPYTYSLTVSGVTATSNQEIIPTIDVTDPQIKALQGANITDAGQSTNTISLKAWGTKPTVDLPIRVILRGD